MEGLGRSYSKPLPSLAFFLFFCLFFVRLFFALFELLVFVVLIFSSDVECLPDNPFFRDCSSFFGFKSLLAFLFFCFVLLLFLFLFFFHSIYWGVDSGTLRFPSNRSQTCERRRQNLCLKNLIQITSYFLPSIRINH